ncbi:FAD/NAD(P)-binding domain-containing protein [Amniculicola lignicola CBS 123094]|uniref:FAD/NAD(P)-binding domain-containing protein n=1 Tax=Amniculicola lignicola CBS 123094 TaxID=1392246 RepID=A0A6A5WG56_9PLEO|nr:FAD/NAD(P)-binding domain-containing protein [Amniculicola lignicola CBS 123094]
MAQNSSSSSERNIVILGGSYAGTSTAHVLLKHVISKLPDPSSYKVILVSAASQAICRPACPRALISDDTFPQEKLFVNLSTVFSQYSKEVFRLVHGKAIKVDHTERNVFISLDNHNTDTETISFHALIIATGASTPSPLLGLNHDETTLKSSWKIFREALRNARSITISGGGPAGIETAGELGEYLNGRAGWMTSKLENPKVPITVFTAGSNILPLLRPSLAKTAEDYLAQVGVTVIKDTRIVSVMPPGAGTEDVGAKATLTLSTGGNATIETDLYIPATGMLPNTSFMEAGLLARDGRIEVDTSTLRASKAGPRVYAVGDASTYARPAVHNILAAIPVLCANIKRDLLLAAGQGASAGNDREFKEDMREMQLVPIGKSKGVGAGMGYKLPSLLVWLVKGRDYWLWTTGGLWSGKQWAKES